MLYNFLFGIVFGALGAIFWELRKLGQDTKRQWIIIGMHIDLTNALIKKLKLEEKEWHLDMNIKPTKNWN